MQTALTIISHNIKTGPIPVSTTSKASCPDACPFKAGGCYAKSGPLNIHWKKISENERGSDFDSFCNQISKLRKNTFWRHNQAGDLSGVNNSINKLDLEKLVKANKGKLGFTYTHKPVLLEDVKDNNLTTREKTILINSNRAAIESANKNGFTINLSGNNVNHADKLKALNIAPVVTVVNSETKGNQITKSGNKVVICPATYRDNVNCDSCRLCQKAGRGAIVAFPSHGTQKKMVNAIVS
jgi:hypothetical protein